MPRKTNAQLQDELYANQKAIKYLQERLNMAHKEIQELKHSSFTVNKTAQFFRKRTNFTTNITDEMASNVTNMDYLNTYLQQAIISWQEDNKKYQERYTTELHKTKLLEVRINDFENTFTLANNIALAQRK